MTAKTQTYLDQAADQRADGRIATCLNGRLFFPAEQIELDCEVKNVSAGGAGVCCDEPPPLDSFVMLDIEGFGRFACVTVRFADNELGLKFVFNEVQRHRLMRELLAGASKGSATGGPAKSPEKESSGKASRHGD
jgi:hypothetical protein